MRSLLPRVKYHNRIKVLLCYLLAWGLALAVPLAALLWVYPYKLAGSAPDLAAPFSALAAALPAQARDALHTGDSGAALTASLIARDLLWRVSIGAAVAAVWLISLLIQLLWRARFSHPRHGVRSIQRAVTAYRLSMLLVLGVCAAGAGAVTLFGLRLVAAPTVWDTLICLCGFAVIPFAALVCFRLAAPPALSGKKAFFKRL